jgi:hypothetical protein
MPRSRRQALLLLLTAPVLAACGGRPGSAFGAAHAQPPIPAAARPAPLDEANISEYLQVMREAAQRVQHPTAAERQMLARADAITAAANRGDVTAGANDGDVLGEALAFRMQMDLQVAKAHRLDPARYQALSERIEDEAGELYCDAGSPVPDPLLKPHVAEIEHLVGIVRNPGPVGSPPIPPACADQ